MKKLLLTSGVFIYSLFSISAFAVILEVPGTYATIQSAIDASVDGDTVLVQPGTYYEHLTMNGKNILLCSRYLTTGKSSFIANTMIDGSNTGRVITINQNESADCRIVGFTIQHGNSSSEPYDYYGGGIMIMYASPEIRSCIIQNSVAPANGGGLCIGQGSGSKVIGCTIQNNSADGSGGGVFMGDCNPDAELINCIISGNTNTCYCDFNGGGGGVNLYHTGKLTNCLIVNNSAPNASVGGGGVYCDWGDTTYHSILITGCTIVHNTAMYFGGVNEILTGGEFRNCIIWGNTDAEGLESNYNGNFFTNCCTSPLPYYGDGNISADPLFVNAESGNFRLTAGSPCINTGDNFFNDQATDLMGNPRVVDTAVDMGAYEYGILPGTTIQIGSGSDVLDYLPVFTCYGYSYSQQIYLGSEIVAGGGNPGLINKIRFFFTDGGASFELWKDWDLYLGNTNKSEFSDITDWFPVTSLTKVFTGVIPQPVQGTWLELTLSVPFCYNGENLVIAVDENTTGYDCSNTWSSFNAETSRGLLYYSDSFNPDPASPPDANADLLTNISQVQLEIDETAGLITGYVYEQPSCNIPIAGATITIDAYSTVTDSTGFYALSLPSGTYFSMSVSYHDEIQTVSPVILSPGDTLVYNFCFNPYLPPPVGLSAVVTGPDFNNVHLTWLAPGSVADQWLHWDQGTIIGALGFNGPGTFRVASHWPVEDIAPYNGAWLKKIRFVPMEATASYTLKIWKGAEGTTLVYSQPVIDPFISAWNEVMLDTAILIDGSQDLWFGFEVVETAGLPAGLGGGPAIAGKGDMFDPGGGWFSLKLVFNWDFNWPLQAFVSETQAPGSPPVISLTRMTDDHLVTGTHTALAPMPQLKIFDTPVQDNLPNAECALRELPETAKFSAGSAGYLPTGYNVYRDNLMIAGGIPGLFYDDPAMPKGTYDYKVTAQYDQGESMPVGPVHVSIYTCFPPTSLSVNQQTLTITSADLSWTPSTISSSSQWTIEWGYSGFPKGYGNLVSVSGVPSYHFNGLSPGGEYDCYVRTDCGDSDTSAWVKQTFRTHYFICPAGSLPETETCGSSANNGCESTPPAFQQINCGDTVCGNSWLHRTHRDSDWFAFTITGPANISVSYNTEFQARITIAPAPCPTATTDTAVDIYPGFPGTFTRKLPAAGTWYIQLAPAYTQQLNCDSLNRYWMALKCTYLGPPVNTSVQNQTVSAGQSVCFDATQVITVAGNGTTFVVTNGGSVNFIAGQKISFLPGAKVNSGGYMHGKILPAGPFCGTKEATIVDKGAGEEPKPLSAGKPYLRVWPNPTTGNFRLGLPEMSKTELILAEIYTIRGERILSTAIFDGQSAEISLADHPAGIYIVKVLAGSDVFTVKLVRTK